MENFEIALQQSPDNMYIHQKLVIVYKELGLIQKVIESAQIVLRHEKNDCHTIKQFGFHV